MGLLEESKININAVHVEVILKNLIRNSNNLLEPINFKSDEVDDMKILRVSSAILHSNSVALGISFERIMNQILDPDFYKKDGISRLDALYN